MPSHNIGITKLAKLCDITPRQVQVLTAEGVLHRATDDDGKELRGKYPELAIRDYVRHVRSQGKLDDASETEHSALKNRELRARAEMSELRLRQFKGELHEAGDVEFVMTNMLTFFKQRVLAIPSRISRLLVGKQKFQEIYDLISTEIATCLRELSGYDPSAFAQQAAARLAQEGVDLTNLNGKTHHAAKASGAKDSATHGE
jgi:phage terminase Nu1 subunit (DNA packaging protein)